MRWAEGLSTRLVGATALAAALPAGEVCGWSCSFPCTVEDRVPETLCSLAVKEEHFNFAQIGAKSHFPLFNQEIRELHKPGKQKLSQDTRTGEAYL